MGTTRNLLWTLALGLAMGVAGCGGDDEPGGSGTGTDSGTGTGTDSGTGTGFDAGPIASELCPSGCECSDGIDNDGDGLIDGMDPECTGPYDNDEGSFATGIPGDNRDPFWQDCFFDGNSGAGDDGCRYHTDCLTGDRDPSDPSCTVTERCIEFCRPRTPNGCDCFGCCDVTMPGGTTVTIQIGTGCSIDNVDDASACPPCVKSLECTNECGTCELCPGRTLADLPPECSPEDGGTPTYMCDDGVTCANSGDCGGDEYCSLGCCLAAPI